MFYEPNGCGFGQTQSVFGTFTLPPGGTFNGFKLFVVSLTTGNYFPVSFNPIFFNPNEYWQWMNPPDFASVPPSEQTGEFKFLLAMIYEVNGQTFTASSWNDYPFFTHDIGFNCIRGIPGMQKQQRSDGKEFKLDRNADPNRYRKQETTETPNRMILTANPTDGRFSILMDKSVEKGTVNIIDVSGSIIQSSVLKNQKQTQIDISSQKQGVYIITGMAGSNEIYSQKKKIKTYLYPILLKDFP